MRSSDWSSDVCSSDLDGAVAVAFYGPLRAVHCDRGVDAAHAAAARLRHRRVADERDRRGALDILALEGFPDQLRPDLLAGLVGDLLDRLAELDLEPARHLQHDVGL